MEIATTTSDVKPVWITYITTPQTYEIQVHASEDSAWSYVRKDDWDTPEDSNEDFVEGMRAEEVYIDVERRDILA